VEAGEDWRGTGRRLIKEIWSTSEAVRPDPYLKTYDWAKA